MTQTAKKLLIGFAAKAAAGGALGLLAAMFRAVSSRSTLGALGSGLMLWMTAGAWLALQAKCGLHAALSVLSLLVGMLCGTVLGTAWLTGWVNPYLLVFWLLLLLPAALMAWILRANAGKAWLRALGIAAGLAGVFCDVFILQCAQRLPALCGEAAMLFAVIYFANTGSRQLRYQ